MMELPWPPSVLNPNTACHYMTKATAKKNYRQTCGWIAKTVAPNTTFSIELYPPNNRPNQNIDNVISALKGAIDGIQDAWGIDDSEFKITWPTEFSEVTKGGKVVVRFG